MPSPDDSARVDVEQRRFQRLQITLSVSCYHSGLTTKLYTDDVSASGMRCFSQYPLLDDEEVTVSTSLSPGEPLFETRAKVVWVREEGKDQYSIGLQFDNLEDEARRRWTEFLTKNRM